ncbi:MAG: aminoglycoside phosphotransferase family protein [Anaerolineales bacterium]|nr:aminoglycoside phosphotransferase family protein [Anaerolineales bacterium]
MFIENLPNLIDQASARWGLTNIQPVSNLSYNFVAFAKQSNVTLSKAKGLSDNKKETLRSLRSLRETHNHDVILKIGVPCDELNSEMAALKLFNGNGACQLLECDEERGFLLLERLKPGTMLAELEDDDERTHIAAEVMTKLWREIPAAEDSGLSIVSKFIQLSKWFDELKKLRTAFDGGTGPFPDKLVTRVEETLPRLYAESSPPCLIHGDFHHFNVLSSERGWIVIDPKGVIGHPEYEVGPLLINPWGSFLNGTNPKVQTGRRLSILSEQLGFPRQRLLDWALCHAILSAWWDMQPDGTGGEYSLRCAELFANL